MFRKLQIFSQSYKYSFSFTLDKQHFHRSGFYNHYLISANSVFVRVIQLIVLVTDLEFAAHQEFKVGRVFSLGHFYFVSLQPITQKLQ